jgi:PEP-CTERM motif
MHWTIAALVGTVVIAGQATASTITWGLATNTTGASSISTSGSLVRAFDSGGSGATVNGVVFAPAGSLGDDVWDSLGAGRFTFGALDDNADLGDAGLDTLLRTADIAGAIGVLPSSIATTVVLGVEIGVTYEIQLFFMDQRNSSSSPPNGCVTCADRYLTLTSGPNVVTLDADPGNSLAAPFGQFALGTFTADSTSQTFEITGGILFDPFWNGPLSNRQVNAWQLRVVPEPGTAVLLGIGISLLSWRRRRIAR